MDPEALLDGAAGKESISLMYFQVNVRKTSQRILSKATFVSLSCLNDDEVKI
jgi:hypothetical protein